MLARTRSASLRVVAALGLAAGAAAMVAIEGSNAGASSNVRTIEVKPAAAYKPVPPKGATDEYHCTVLNPHITQDSMMVSSNFHPDTKELHHVILYIVPPKLVAQAQQLNDHGKGWTCFGTPQLGGFGGTPWLTGWAPGDGKDVLPAQYGVPLAKGSEIITQIHYNTLAGDKPDKSWASFQVVPTSSTTRQPIRLVQLPATPDIPCPAGVTGPLCNRAASLADQGQRFGQSAVDFVNTLERICGHDPANPPAGDTTSCTYSMPANFKIVRATPHMHLLGSSETITLNPGTPQQQVILDKQHYNFDDQRAKDLATPVQVHAGDKIQVSCTYDPTLRQRNPQTKHLPPRFVTWGDGSSDEMCLAILSVARAN